MKYLIALLLIQTLSYGDTPWTFRFKRQIHHTGMKAHPVEMPEEVLFEGEIPKSFNLSSLAILSPIMDQKKCGSCVYNSVVKNIEDLLRIRGKVLPRLSRQFLMDCGSGWSCEGSYFSKVAEDLVNLGGDALESFYPYKARNEACRPVSVSNIAVSTAGFRIINNSPKSIMGALLMGYPVSVTVAANAPWMGYDGGIYNACNGTAVNHEVLIEGFDCEDAVDEKGFCKFNAEGNLPRGKGIWYVVNSWGEGWGEGGIMRSKITSRRGNKCNRLADEAGILEVAK